MADGTTQVIAGASLLVSAIAVILGWQANRKANATQARLLEIEDQRERDRVARAKEAILRAELDRNTQGVECLYIRNDGECEARNLSLKMDGKPFGEHPAVLAETKAQKEDEN
jgi:uncharacterized membrane protein YdfJ with MMPL/SSD domain